MEETFEEFCQRIGLTVETVQASHFAGFELSCQVGPEPFEREVK